MGNNNNNPRYVLSIDPGFRNLAFALVNSTEDEIIKTKAYDMGVGEFGKCKQDITRFIDKVDEFFDDFFQGFLLKVNVVLVERQGQSKFFARVEGVLCTLVRQKLGRHYEYQGVDPQAVGKWVSKKGKSGMLREEKKRWTVAQIKKRFDVDVGKDEADALLNYLYWRDKNISKVQFLTLNTTKCLTSSSE